MVSGETGLNCIGPEWASVGPRLGPIESDDLPKASKTGMPEVHSIWPHPGSNQHPITGVYDCNDFYKLKSVRREKGSSIWPESGKIT